MQAASTNQTGEEGEEPPPPPPEKVIPEYGTKEWIQYWAEFEGNLPTPINVSITGSIKYFCPELKWYNFDVFPHKIKITNTGYTVVISAKWKTERPYLEGGHLIDKHVFSTIHFHWGANMMQGCDHNVDNVRHPAEMHVSFFRSEYLTQEEALKHDNGVMMVCYLIKYGVTPDERLDLILEAFPKIKESKSHTRIGPYPLSQLMPMFFEDYFLYWGSLVNAKGESFAVRWCVPRITLHATFDQMKKFRKLWDPWDEPILGNFRPLRDVGDRHVFFISPHWCQYNSLLPIPRVREPSISVLSPAYQANPWMLPPQNAYMKSKDENVEQPPQA